MYLSLAGRTLIGLYFVFFGVWNIYHWIPVLRGLLRDHLGHPFFLMTIGIMLQIAAGTMIMFNILVPFAALFLLPFTVISVCIFHPYWQHQGDLRKLHFAIFVTTLTMSIGALLLLSGCNESLNHLL